MGVKGLWRLLLPIGRRISIETLAGKTLAVDASIWLTQLLKAMRDPETGRVVAAAHLIGFFRRLCRLRFHGIKPVFVFDGATPEIKKRELSQRRARREQFATLTTESVQRLAKKILAETLQKQQIAAAAKKSKKSSGGAFAAGFDPGEQEARREEVAAASASAAGDQEEEDDDGKPAAVATNGNSQDQEDSEVEVLSPSQPQQQQQQQQEVSDWDLPLAVAAAEEAKEMEKEEEEDDENNVEYETFNDFSQTTTSTTASISVEQIASLPATQRKDAIETAKRQQRLQARKEFMPAAANPLDFSQVQLQNFLKSCRLNKDIATMAKAAAAKDNRGLTGEVMASDRTTRVELLREEEEDEEEEEANDDKSSQEGPVSLLEAKLKSKKLQRRKVAAKAPDDNKSSDDDESWGEVNNNIKMKAATSKRRVIEDDGESSNDESVKEVAVRASTGRVYVRETIELDDNDDDDDDMDTGGGFVVPDDRKPAAQRSIIQINDDEDDDSVEEEDGGFLKRSTRAETNQTPAGPPETVDIQDSDEIAGGFLKTDPLKQFDRQSEVLSDARYAQELEDRAIAEALQQEENVAGVPDSQRAQQQEYTTGTLTDTEDSMLAQVLQRTATDAALPEREIFQGNESTRMASHVTRDPPDGNSGNMTNNSRGDATQKDGAKEAGDNFDSDDDDVDWEDGASITRKGESMAPRKEVIEVDDEQGDSEDELDWEDGDASNEHEGTSTAPDSSTLNVGGGEIESITHSPSICQSQTSDKERHQISNPMSLETSAALLHAQTTAANLTNWAGRAFRRAIQEAGGGSESPPKTVAESSASTNADKSCEQTMATTSPFFSSQAVDGMMDQEENIGPDDSLPANLRAAATAAPAVAGASTAEPFDAAFLQENETQWTAERNKRERDMDTISDEMLEEAKELLQLFGVPYVEAPAEAEAQCAALEQLGLVDGIVTEDSDVFVFNGNTVYKNIFDEQKYAEVYRAEDAEREMRLGRNAMVALAMMLGGDYTEGIKGVGIVNAMEILDTFDVSQDLKGGLTSFKKWLDGFDPADFNGKSTERTKMTKEQRFHVKHRTARARWIAPPNFPAANVMKAYLDPVVDKSTDRFSWGVPDVEKLITFCNRHIGWSPEETERILDPVVKELGNGMRQTRIDSFMRYEDSIKFADVRSKRLREVLGLKGGGDGVSEAGHDEEKSSKKKRSSS